MPAALAAVLAACGPTAAPAPPTATPEPSATLAPTATPTPSGPLTAIKVACWGPVEACRMAAEAAAPIQGVQPEVKVVDGAAGLADDRAVLGLVGPPDGGSALRDGPALEAAEIGFVSPSATVAKLTNSGWRTAHRLVARDDQLGPAAAERVFGPPLDAKSADVVDGGTVDGIGLADEFQKRATALGIKVERDGPEAGPGVVFLAGGCEALPKLAGRTVMVTARCAGQVGPGTYVADGRLDSGGAPQEQAWAADYGSRFGSAPGPFAEGAYDATRIVLEAIRRAAAAKGSLLLRPADVDVEIGRTAGFQALGGAVTFDDRGDLARPKWAIGVR